MVVMQVGLKTAIVKTLNFKAPVGAFFIFQNHYFFVSTLLYRKFSIYKNIHNHYDEISLYFGYS